MGLRDRVRPLPSSVTGELAFWLTEMANAVNNQPFTSYFSGTTPNSVVTGLAGDVTVNIGSASTDTRAWVKGGSPTIPDQTCWVPLRTGPI